MPFLSVVGPRLRDVPRGSTAARRGGTVFIRQWSGSKYAREGNQVGQSEQRRQLLDPRRLGFNDDDGDVAANM